jgi:uncharacterized protein (DUF2141 family)
MKCLLLLFLFLSSVLICKAQVNPIPVVDSLNSKLNEIEKNIDKGLLNISETGNPFKAPKDSTAVFDSLHGKLVVIIKNLNSTMGTLNVALYNSYKAFANKSRPYKGASMSITDFVMTIPFDSISPGVYSVAAFHDEDKNGVLKTNQLNIPIEGYCFSNNIGTSLGPPDYNKIKFVYTGKNRTMTLYMTYFKFPK